MTYLILEDYLFPLLCINKGIISISIMDTTVEEDYICIYLQMHPFEKIHCDYMSATWKQSRLTGLTTQELLF